MKDNGNNPVRIDLVCGFYPKPGYIGIDNLYGARSQVETGKEPDIVCDLSIEPIPFAENSVDEVHSCHFLEHVDISRMLDEIFRVLKPQGMFVAVLPYALSNAGLYPGHTAFYTDEWWRANKQVNDLFLLTEFRFRKSEIYKRLSLMHRMFFPFSLARNILVNACDEFVVIGHPKKGFWPSTLPLAESDY
jgi:SAM-dependent methyltransferase